MSTVDDLIEEFSDLDETEAYQLLDELGRELPKYPDSVYQDHNLVPGCQSRVWMVNRLSDDCPATLQIQADSDAIIVKGLVSLLLEMYSGLTPKEALELDYAGTFDAFGLSRLITPQRKNGLHAMVQTVRAFAAVCAGEATATGSDSEPRERTIVEPSRSIEGIATEFPILQRTLPSGQLPVFLDSGASAQKPTCVIEKEQSVQEEYYANAFRGRYYFGQRVDDEIESTRQSVADLINAERIEEIVFTSGTTMSINMVAASWGRKHLNPGDEILITEMEHHANFVPWQVVAEQTGANLVIWPIDSNRELDLSLADTLINDKTAIVAISSMSNVLGTNNPIAQVVDFAHQKDAVVMVDAAQSIPHSEMDVRQLDIDFLTFSGHKLYGPSGVGVLFGKETLLDSMDPFMYGGHMIQTVGREKSTWSAVPARLEAGTMPIVQVIALGTAIEFVRSIGYDAIAEHEHALTVEAHKLLNAIEGLTIHGPSVEKKGAIVSFSIDSVATEDLAIRLDQRGIFTRHGHHCAMVLHEKLGVPATTRASFGIYNTLDDVKKLAHAIQESVGEIR